HKHQSNVYYFDKTRYSAFVGTDLEIRLRERDIQEVHLVGVCTDICILHTAIDAYNKGFDIVVHKKGVASFNAVGHQWSLEHFENKLGAKVIYKRRLVEIIASTSLFLFFIASVFIKTLIDTSVGISYYSPSYFFNQTRHLCRTGVNDIEIHS